MHHIQHGELLEAGRHCSWNHGCARRLPNDYQVTRHRLSLLRPLLFLCIWRWHREQPHVRGEAHAWRGEQQAARRLPRAVRELLPLPRCFRTQRRIEHCAERNSWAERGPDDTRVGCLYHSQIPAEHRIITYWWLCLISGIADIGRRRGRLR